ncbi:unnamed protein product, partial [Ectocarpus sp. 12 AP-2014]
TDDARPARPSVLGSVELRLRAGFQSTLRKLWRTTTASSLVKDKGSFVRKWPSCTPQVVSSSPTLRPLPSSRRFQSTTEGGRPCRDGDAYRPRAAQGAGHHAREEPHSQRRRRHGQHPVVHQP